jgi:hypothetical protein
MMERWPASLMLIGAFFLLAEPCRADGYVKEVYQAVHAHYQELGCRERLCSLEEFKKDFFKHPPRNKEEVVILWKSLANYSPQERAVYWITSLYSDLQPQMSEKPGSLSQSTVIWLVLDQALRDLSLPKKDPSSAALTSEWRLRAFEALLFHINLKVGFKREGLFKNIYEVRMAALKARVLRFQGDSDAAKRLLIQLLSAPAFSKPEMANSPLYRQERIWIWGQLYETLGELKEESTQKVTMMLGKPYIEAREGVAARREAHLREWMGDSRKKGIEGELRLSDPVNQTYL